MLLVWHQAFLGLPRISFAFISIIMNSYELLWFYYDCMSPFAGSLFELQWIPMSRLELQRIPKNYLDFIMILCCLYYDIRTSHAFLGLRLNWYALVRILLDYFYFITIVWCLYTEVDWKYNEFLGVDLELHGILQNYLYFVLILWAL